MVESETNIYAVKVCEGKDRACTEYEWRWFRVFAGGSRIRWSGWCARCACDNEWLAEKEIYKRSAVSRFEG